MKRVRVLGDLYHGRIPEGAVYIGRAAPGLPASPFANPFRVSQHGHDTLRLYSEHLDRHPELVARAVRELAGKDLACWCKEGAPCHGDELLRRIRLAPFRALPSAAQSLIEAARELASKVELPREKFALLRFLRAIVDAEVELLGMDREESRRCWGLAEVEALRGAEEGRPE